MRSNAATDPQTQNDASAEAARWVEDALENARSWFSDLSEDELREPLEQAFELASRSGRGEREFHAVFEAEARRAIEERDVMGSSESVLPRQSGSAPQPFNAIAADPMPPGEIPVATVDERAPSDTPEHVADEPERSAPVAEEPEVPPEQPEEDEYDEDRARAFGLAVGALRFQEGLSPDEIQARGIGAEYYAEVMEWLLDEVDRTLRGDYPAHLNRHRLSRFAAGLQDPGASLATERHVRDCAGCSEYLADLLDGALRAVAPDAAPEERAAVLRITAVELEKYRRPDQPKPRRPRDSQRPHRTRQQPARARQRPEPTSPDPEPRTAAADRLDRRRRQRVAPVFDGDWLPKAGRIALVLGLAVTVAVVALDAGRGGSDGDRAEPTPTPSSTELASGSALGEAFPTELKEAMRARQERAERRRRAEQLAERRRRALAAERRAARERAAQRARAQSPPPATVTSPPRAQAPAPSAPAAPAPTRSTPPPSQPPPGEFGLEP